MTALFGKIDCLNLPAPDFDIQMGLCAVAADLWGNVLVLLDTSKGLLRVDENKRVIGNST